MSDNEMAAICSVILYVLGGIGFMGAFSENPWGYGTSVMTLILLGIVVFIFWYSD